VNSEQKKKRRGPQGGRDRGAKPCAAFRTRTGMKKKPAGHENRRANQGSFTLGEEAQIR
jgi:hypothetical protein